jgi:trehalose monomycolate/heme transporter
MTGLGSWIYRQQRPLALLFVLALGVFGWFGKDAARGLSASGFDDPRSESAQADAMLDARFGLGTPQLLAAYSHASLTLDDPVFADELAATIARVRQTPGVVRVGSPADSTALVSRDRHTVVLALRLDDGGDREALLDRVGAALSPTVLRLRLGGALAAGRQAQAAAEADLARAELVTLPLVAVLLVVFFRGVVMALLPLCVGGFAVAAALSSVRALSHVTEVSVFAMNIVTFVGLGLAIDYSLFMTSRFRDELHAGHSPEAALRIALHTSGRTIAYSGAAVAVSLLALSVFPLVLLRSVAWAGSLVVVMSLVGALIFLPALLAVLGPRIEWGSLGQKHAGETPKFWHRLAAVVMRAPVLVTVVVTALLVGLGLPFLSVRPSVAGLSTLPRGSDARSVGEQLVSGAFDAPASDDVLAVVQFPRDALGGAELAALERYVGEVRAVPHVTRVDAVVSDAHPAAALSAALASQAAPRVRQELLRIARGDATVVRVVLDVSPSSDAAHDAIRAVRGVRVDGGKVLVTSPAARIVDLQDALLKRLGLALGIIGTSTFLVLFLAFGSVVMPIKAIVMNVLSLGASFGALVWVFQEGRFEGLLDFESPGTIELTIPIVMFAVVFGLAMDYELFLLSRIRESYEESSDTHQSVTHGLERTGQLISRAALLLVAVMIGFVSADMLLVKELGVGMAVAVIVDATIVRALLVPATMQLLGAYNWWAPRPLARLWHKLHLGVDERADASVAGEEAAPRESLSGSP